MKDPHALKGLSCLSLEEGLSQVVIVTLMALGSLAAYHLSSVKEKEFSCLCLGI